MNYFFLTLICVLSLVSCTNPPVDPATQQATAYALPSAWPRCPSLESSWGVATGPFMEVSGNLAMGYSKPGKHNGQVTINYEGKNPKHTIIRSFDGTLASDGQMIIMGKQVGFYGSGNEDAAISTQPMQLINPAGEAEWFSFSFSAEEHLAGKNIPVFTW